MRLLHHEQNRPHHGVPFENRTLGDCLEEFYIGAFQEMEELRRRSPEDLSADEVNRKAVLMDIMEGNVEASKRHALFDLSESESEEVWHTPHKTGDPLADYWEEQIARGEEPDFDLTEVPTNG